VPRAGGFLPVSVPMQRHHEYRTSINGVDVSDNAAWLHQVGHDADAVAGDEPEALLTPSEKAKQTIARKRAEAEAQSAAEDRRERLNRQSRWWHPKFGGTYKLSRELRAGMTKEDLREFDEWAKGVRLMLRERGIVMRADDTTELPLTWCHPGTFMGRPD